MRRIIIILIIILIKYLNEILIKSSELSLFVEILQQLCELNLLVVADYNNFIIPTEDTMSCSLIDCIWIKIDIHYCSYQSVGLIYFIFNLLSISVTKYVMKTTFLFIFKRPLKYFIASIYLPRWHTILVWYENCSMTSCHVYSYLLQNGTRSFVKSHDHF